MKTQPVCTLHKIPFRFQSQAEYDSHMRNSKDLAHRTKRNIMLQAGREKENVTEPMHEKTAWEQYYGNYNTEK